jgi:hypothetical protein
MKATQQSADSELLKSWPLRVEKGQKREIIFTCFIEKKSFKIFSRTNAPRKFSFIRKLPDIVQNQVCKILEGDQIHTYRENL